SLLYVAVLEYVPPVDVPLVPEVDSEGPRAKMSMVQDTRKMSERIKTTKPFLCLFAMVGLLL
ncbi:MAG: hypothetical protein IKT95_00780, partial [Spirochaetales bacterium]|nr:hypothetical protein [Spirochaetales bacterium]